MGRRHLGLAGAHSLRIEICRTCMRMDSCCWLSRVSLGHAAAQQHELRTNILDAHSWVVAKWEANFGLDGVCPSLYAVPSNQETFNQQPLAPGRPHTTVLQLPPK